MSKTKTVLTRNKFVPRAKELKQFAKSLDFHVDFLYKMPGYELRAVRVRVSKYRSNTTEAKGIFEVGKAFKNANGREFIFLGATGAAVQYSDANGSKFKLSWFDFVWKNIWTIQNHQADKKHEKPKEQKQSKPPPKNYARPWEFAKVSTPRINPSLSSEQVNTLLAKIRKIQQLADRPGTECEGLVAKSKLDELKRQLYV